MSLSCLLDTWWQRNCTQFS